MTPPEKLVYMANQISRAFAHQGVANGAQSVADHLRAFWEPGMRRRIVAHLACGGEGLTPIARRAVHSLAEGGGDAVLGDPTAGDPDVGGERTT